MNFPLKEQVDELKSRNLFRAPKGEWGEGFLNFTTNDYLSLSRRAEVIVAGVKAAETYGAGATASRIAGGNHPLYAELEIKLAAFKGAESACVFGSGYLANLGVISALAGEGDVVFTDKLSHSCMLEGVKLSGAKLVRFKHNDLEDLKKLMARNQGRALIMTEEIFSMDGDFAPVAELRKIAANAGAMLLVDGAHSLYAPKAYEVGRNEVYVGTLSKAIGGYGGYACGSRELIELLHNKAKTLIYSTGLPPFVIGSAIKALEIAGDENLYKKTIANVEYFCSQLNIAVSGSAIVPIVLGSEEKVLRAEKFLKERKILVAAIRPPTVPPGTSRLRISFNAGHKKEEIDLLANLVKQFLHENI